MGTASLRHVFAVLASAEADGIASATLSTLHGWLEERGFRAEGEHVRIHDVPVRFLPGDPPLWAEALAEARTFATTA